MGNGKSLALSRNSGRSSDAGAPSPNALAAQATGNRSMAKGVNRGYLARDYVPAIFQGYQGIVEKLIKTDATGRVILTQCCQVAGLGFTTSKGRPRDGSFGLLPRE